MSSSYVMYFKRPPCIMRTIGKRFKINSNPFDSLETRDMWGASELGLQRNNEEKGRERPWCVAPTSRSGLRERPQWVALRGRSGLRFVSSRHGNASDLGASLWQVALRCVSQRLHGVAPVRSLWCAARPLIALNTFLSSKCTQMPPRIPCGIPIPDKDSCMQNAT
ncbi:hypothetical protein F2Q68_00018574 [Brassica cretica]|uniref:Uncharacterized protein n=1 Tax=Brassica cretica TaxID=69181 RepID=A0A8S9FSQ2_BRACR|nr:hypothetical protein F2Q68_00018574 [Brassica cretica]